MPPVQVSRLLEREASPWHGARGMLVCLRPGRGKTLGALLHTLRAAQARVRAGGTRFGHPTLVVVPSQLLHQWEEQIRTHFAPNVPCGRLFPCLTHPFPLSRTWYS